MELIIWLGISSLIVYAGYQIALMRLKYKIHKKLKANPNLTIHTIGNI